jgi:hypothetical protein
LHDDGLAEINVYRSIFNVSFYFSRYLLRQPNQEYPKNPLLQLVFVRFFFIHFLHQFAAAADDDQVVVVVVFIGDGTKLQSRSLRPILPGFLKLDVVSLEISNMCSNCFHNIDWWK